MLMEPGGSVLRLEPADEALCARVAERDDGAFELLYDRYAQRVHAWAAHVLGARQAEDVTQEIFAQLWRRAGQFNQSRGEFSHWFWALTRHRIMRELRGVSQQRRLQAAQEIAALLSAAIEEGVDIEDVAFAGLESQRALDALAQLPDEQRRVLAMSYFVGLSHSAIALQLKLPLGTVKKRARLGMQKLRQQLLDEEEAGKAPHANGS